MSSIKLLYAAIFSLMMGTVIQQGCSSTVSVFQNDAYSFASPVTSSFTLGKFPYVCLGDVRTCTNGFTLSFWLQTTAPSSDTQPQYIISGGGSWASTNGYYVRRQYGNMFEFGVAVNNTLWRVSQVTINTQASWSHLTMTWSGTVLTVYVDGYQLPGADSRGSSRFYVSPAYEPFPRIWIGQATEAAGTGPTGSPLASPLFIYNVRHEDRCLPPQDVQLLTAQNQTLLLQSCLSSLPSGSQAGISGSAVTIDSCRYACAATPAQAAFVQTGISCKCSSSFSTSAGPGIVPLCSASQFSVYWSTHYNAVPLYRLGLTVSLASASQPVYTGNTAVLMLAVSYFPNIVVFTVDFNDGQNLTTSDTQVEHTWTSAGSYQVNVKAVSSLVTESAQLTVVVTDQPSTPPSNMFLQVTSDTNPYVVDVYAEGYSIPAMNCSFIFDTGDQSVVVSGANGISMVSGSEVFSAASCHGVTWQCSNVGGTSSVSQVAHVADPNVHIVVMSSADGFTPLFDPNALQSCDEAVLFQINSQPVSPLPTSPLSLPVGQYSVQLAVGSDIVSSEVVVVYKPIGRLSIQVTSGPVRDGVAATFNFSIIDGGDSMASVSYGDGSSKDLAIVGEAASFSFTDSHTFLTMGEFTVTLTVANDVSYTQITRIVVVESAIVQASLAVTNATNLYDSVGFALIIQTLDGPAQVANVTFDFGDGDAPVTNILLPVSAGQFQYGYVYSAWGTYNCTITINNGFGSKVLQTAVQVGTSITVIDLFVNKIRVLSGDNATFTAYVPHGMPVNLNIDFGDGSTSTQTVNGTSENLPSSNPAVCAAPTNNPITFVHAYAASGMYTVVLTAQNQFSQLSATLTPRVTVISAANAKSSVCSSLSLAASPKTSATAPLVTMRSSVVVLSTQVSASCASPSGASNVQYTWFARQNSQCYSWQTVSQLSLTGSNSSILTIGPNTLWYGLYSISVTAGLSNALDPQATATFYVQITPSPLIINIGDGTSATFYTWLPLTVHINVTDPDVSDPGNVTGMSMYVFCYKKTSQPTMSPLTLNGLLQASTNITENWQGTVAVFDTISGDCWNRSDRVWIAGYADVAGPAGDIKLTSNGSATIVFDVIVTKDGRQARASLDVTILSTNVTKASAASFGALDDLIRSGDTTAALTMLGSLMDTLNGNNTGPQTEARTQMISAMNSVSSNVRNMDQADKLSGLLSDVTSVSTELTDNSKSLAVNAVGQTASVVENLASTATTDQIKSTATNVLGAVGNVVLAPAPPPPAPPAPPLTMSMGRGLHGSSTAVPMTTLAAMTSAATTAATTTEAVALLSSSRTTARPVGPSQYTSAGRYTTVGRSVGSTMSPTLANSRVTTATPSATTKASLASGKRRRRRSATTPAKPASQAPVTVSRSAAYCNKTIEQPDPFLVAIGQAEPNNETNPCCCQRVGLCLWLEPMTDAAYVKERQMPQYDVDVKIFYWDDVLCDGVHPDDMTEYIALYAFWNNLLKARANAKAKTITNTAIGGVSRVGRGMQKKTDSNSDLSVQSPKMNLTVAKVGTEVSSFSVPAGVAQSNAGGGMQALTLSDNPYTYSSDGSSIQGGVKSLALTDANGQPLDISGTPQPFDIWMNGCEPNCTGSGPPAEYVVYNNTINYHATWLKYNNSALRIFILPLSGDVKLNVYVKVNGFPNTTYYDWKGSLPLPESSYFPTSDPAEFAELLYTAAPWQNVTTNSTMYRVGIQIADAVDGVSTKVRYQIIMYGAGCRFWHEHSSVWSNDGCWVGNRTTMSQTQCQCNHLTAFGGNVVVAPNTIDFNTVFTEEKFLESAPVFATVVIVIILYIIALVLCRRQDKKDPLRWGATPLEENLPTDQYFYQMTIHTGMRNNAGTKSNISFILAGDTADSGVRALTDGKRKELERGSIVNYVLGSPVSLGDLAYLRIWHDNSGSGKKKGWFLDRIDITDLNTGEKYYFICDKWLAVEEGDGSVERLLPVASHQDFTSSFSYLFSTSARRKITSDHMWFSVVSRPTRSSFTRAQRLSCCIALLFLTMITNCMFFKNGGDASSDDVITLGPFQFTVSQLAISVETTIIVLIPSLVIALCFQKAKARNNAVVQVNQIMSRKREREAAAWKPIGASQVALFPRRKISRCGQLMEWLQSVFASSSSADKYRTQGSAGNVQQKKKKKTVKTFPWWTIYISWTLVFLTIVVSAFFTILYSMQWGRAKSVQWLTTFLLSFVQNVIVVQPIKVLALAALLAFIFRKPDIEDENDDDDNDDLVVNEANWEPRALELMAARRQQMNMEHHERRPPDIESIKKERELRVREIQMETVLKNFITYLIYVLILLFIAYNNRDPDSYHLNANIQNTFVTDDFNEIATFDDFWNYMDNSLMPALYSSYWYNCDPDYPVNCMPQVWQEAQQTADRANVRLGVGRLRQMRVKDNTCKILPVMRSVIDECRTDYNWFDDDTKDYLPGWLLPSSADLYDTTNSPSSPSNGTTVATTVSTAMEEPVNETVEHDVTSPWVYQNSIELMNAPYPGQVATYKGGGYVFNFRRTASKTQSLSMSLQEQNWIDVRTRAVFVEFSLYNANVNLFASVTLLVEYLSTGSAVPSFNIKVFRLFDAPGSMATVAIIFEVLYLVFVIYEIVRTVFAVKKTGRKHFKTFWGAWEFATLILNIAAIGMFIVKQGVVSEAMSRIADMQSGAFVNFGSLGLYDDGYSFVVAFIVFASTISLLKQLTISKNIALLGTTLHNSAESLTNFFFIFAIYMMAFISAFYLLFGSAMSSYCDVTQTIESLFTILLGQFDYPTIHMVQPILGPIMFFLYNIIVLTILLTMFMTIIMKAHEQASDALDLKTEDYAVVDFMIGRLRGFIGI